MADPNKPKSGPDPSANPVEQALSRLRKDFKDTKAVDGLKEEEMRALQARLKKEMQEKSISATAEQLDTLVVDVRMEALERRLDGVNRAATEQENQAAEDVANLYRELRTLATEVGPGAAAAGSKSIFTKEGFKEGLDKSLSKLGDLAKDIAVILDQIKESIASSIGAHIETLKPFLPAGMGDMLEKFIGDDRIHLSKTLAAKGIKLPMESFIHARKSIEDARKATGATSRGWNVERMAFYVVQKLSSAGITGKEDKGILEQKITSVVTDMSAEITNSKDTSPPGFVDTGKPSEYVLKDKVIAGKQVLIKNDGTVTVDGQKWKMEKNGKPFPVIEADFTGGELRIKHATTRQPIILFENLNTTIADLSSRDDSKKEVEPRDSSGDVIVKFVRVT